jgi:hypothetical protein
MVLRPLIEKDPGLALRQLSGRVESMESSLALPLFDAMREWAKRDVAAATAWFDEQAAAGLFEEKRLDSRYLLDRFHGQIIGALISRDRDAAAARFQVIPETKRNDLWIMTLPPGAERQHTLRFILVNKLRDDPEAAAAFAKEHGIK